MIAGGLGGTTGDLLMHSLDTVKTRQQGDPHIPPKYATMSSSYSTILRQEGIRRGLYGGWIPAMLGSFPGTIIFFGTYEYSKRHMIDFGIRPQIAYLTSGMVPNPFSTMAEQHLHISRIHCGFCCLVYICSLRSPQNSIAAPGPIR
jgi:hypothetical protein